MAEAKNKSVFADLYAVDCKKYTEKKNGLTYLSWAWAWAEVKKRYPEATYTIYENANGWNYHTDGRTCWVKTGVIINGMEHIEYLPVMDYRNASIPVEKVTSFDVNKAIQRSLTKAISRHGLGLYIYAGEDLPEDVTPQPKTAAKAPRKAIDGGIYRQLVEAEAKGQRTRTDESPYDYYLRVYQPTDEECASFLQDVENTRKALSNKAA